MSNSRYRDTAFQICGSMVLLVCAIWQIVFALQEQKTFSEGSEKTLAIPTRNFRALTYNAKQKYMLEADLGAATLLLQQALTVNPSYIPAWLSLAELNNDLGQKEKASAILDYVDLLTKGLKRWRWDKALTAYQLGRVEMLPGDLRYIVHELDGKDRNDALQLAFTLWGQPEELLEKIGHENIIHLLGYAVSKIMPKQALFFWNTIEEDGVQWQQKDALALLDMLLQVDEVQTAANIWRKYLNPDKIFFNGDFSQPLLEQAFGWRTGKKLNFDQDFAKNSEGGSTRSIHYRFKGWENINFAHLSQIVPLLSGRTYILTAEMKAQKMTTNERPFLEVTGYKCKAAEANSEMVAPDQDWTEHQVVVYVPEECWAVFVSLRRKESDHIESKLAGQLWVRNFVIAEKAKDPLMSNVPKL
jgi:tetratricopeptide (TPR) repeat protein